MILQSLCRYYDILAADANSEIPRAGWSSAKISFGLVLAPNGELKQIIDLRENATKGKKLVPRSMLVPEQQVRTSGIKPFFLSDKSDYILGVKNEKIMAAQFAAFKDYNLKLLEPLQNEAANAVKTFLSAWQPKKAHDFLAQVSGFSEDILASPNFVFMLGGNYVHEDQEIIALWHKTQTAASADAAIAYCLVSGQKSGIAVLHPQIKGVRGAQSTGASLVSFNATAFKSYGKESGYNSPVSESRAFGYTTMLNWLLRGDSSQKMQIGDATVVFWADSPVKAYSVFFRDFANPEIKGEQGKSEEERAVGARAEKEIGNVLLALSQHRKAVVDDEEIDPETNFYILGLAPNNARISVRFFLRDTFGDFVAKMDQHYRDLEIADQRYKYPPLWMLLNETVVKNAREKNPAPVLAGNVATAVFTGARYPTALLAAIILRIRADHDVNWLRAAIIKACLLRKARIADNNKLQEVLTVSLNAESTNQAYLLGRLFAVLERVQISAQGDINKTIKDSYFSTASATPRGVFAQLITLAQHHLAKLPESGNVYFNKLMGEIIDNIQSFPATLNLDEQGQFILGYYQQRQYFFIKKSADKENTEAAQS